MKAAGGHSYEHVTEDVTLVRLVGEMDVYTTPDARKLLVDLVNHGRRFLVLDLTAIEWLDSTGMGVLLGADRRVRAHNGAVALVVSSERIHKQLRITGFIKIFPTFATADRAVEHLGRKAREHA
ncbi:STAS domain-containing protein [Streptomyces sp. NPDC003635]